MEPAPGGGFRARCRFRDYDGKTRDVERTGKTKGAARAALTASLVERSAPAGDSITGSTRLQDVAEVWVAEKWDDLATQSRRRYRECLDLHILPGLGALTVSECTVSRLDRFLKAVGEQAGSAAARSCRSVLSGVMGLAVRHGAANTNPIRDVAGITATAAEPRALTLDEVAAIRRTVAAWQSGASADASKPKRGRPPTQDLLDIVDLLLATGARIGELLAIRWEDVDLDAGTVTLSGTIVRDEKPARLLRQEKPKTRGSERTLLLPRFALDALMRRRVGLTVANVHDVVFPSAAGTLRDPGSVRKQIRKVLTPAGLGWVSPHVFRKTVATVVAAERDLEAAAEQLGHAGGSDVTRRHYVQKASVAPDVRAALDALAPQEEITAPAR